MKITIYPEGTPRYREPIYPLLSSGELTAAEEEFDYRENETQLYYDEAVERGNVRRARQMLTALKLLDREKKIFFRVQEDLKQGLRLVGSPLPAQDDFQVQTLPAAAWCP